MFTKKSQQVFELVDQHYDYVFECCTVFEKFIGDFVGGGTPDVLNAEFKQIDELEGLADHTRRAIVNAFPEASLLPSTRKEILEIIENIDKIANRCQDISRQLIYEKVVMPDIVKTGMTDIMSLTMAQFSMMSKALEQLFGEYEQLSGDNSILNDIKRTESKVDIVELNLIKALYQTELPLAEKSQTKYFISRLADLSDLLEDIADKIQIMIVLRKV